MTKKTTALPLASGTQARRDAAYQRVAKRMLAIRKKARASMLVSEDALKARFTR